MMQGMLSLRSFQEAYRHKSADDGLVSFILWEMCIFQTETGHEFPMCNQLSNSFSSILQNIFYTSLILLLIF